MCHLHVLDWAPSIFESRTSLVPKTFVTVPLRLLRRLLPPYRGVLVYRAHTCVCGRVSASARVHAREYEWYASYVRVPVPVRARGALVRECAPAHISTHAHDPSPFAP